MSVVQILLPLPISKTLSYSCPDEIRLEPGDYVRVPFRKHEKVGVVWAHEEGNQTEPASHKLKTVLERMDLPPMRDSYRVFITRMASYTLSDLGAVLRLGISVPKAFEPPAAAVGYVLRPRRPGDLSQWETGLEETGLEETGLEETGLEETGLEKPIPIQEKKRKEQYDKKYGKEYGKITPVQKKVLLYLARKKFPCRLSVIVKECGVSASVVKTLNEKGLLETADITACPPCRYPDPSRKKWSLSAAQQQAAERVIQQIKAGKNRTFLLDGVTGAGKTEVYFEAVAQTLRMKRQALILVPEIALSNAFIDRFRERFGCEPALWHSALSPALRRLTWHGVATGRSRVVIGARSALMLPYRELGIIVVDEEHDPAYKQEDGVLYNARDMAVLRGYLEHIPVMLVSATPSLETVVNCRQGKYKKLLLPERHGGAVLPDVRLLDMRKEKPGKDLFIADTLKEGIARRLIEGTQTLLFLNRRGYAPLTLCRACGYRLECPRCTAWLVEHRSHSHMACHHCGFTARMPESCPACKEDALSVCGPGVERIEEEVRSAFPKARLAVLSSDTVENPDDLKTALDRIHNHEVDIVIGTQIIAKGHHFPKLSLVGVIDADLGLAGGDLRAAERTFQLLYQVSGRAGREQIKGEVFLQTFAPDNRIMQALQNDNRDAFLDVEAEQRMEAHMPPFSRLAGIILSSRDEHTLNLYGRELVARCPHQDGLTFLGPAPAPIYRLRGRFRKRFLIIAEKDAPLQRTIAWWLDTVPVKGDVRIAVDIDPQNFM